MWEEKAGHKKSRDLFTPFLFSPLLEAWPRRDISHCNKNSRTSTMITGSGPLTLASDGEILKSAADWGKLGLQASSVEQLPGINGEFLLSEPLFLSFYFFQEIVNIWIHFLMKTRFVNLVWNSKNFNGLFGMVKHTYEAAILRYLVQKLLKGRVL